MYRQWLSDAVGNLMSGREALVAFAASVHGARHVVANPVVDIAGDTATVRAYILLSHGEPLSVVGTYEDDVVRTDDGWRFAKRVFTPEAAR